MGKKLFVMLMAASLAISLNSAGYAAAKNDYSGKLVKRPGSSAIYYIDEDGKRNVFPNEKTYKSWFSDFSNVLTISEQELADYPIIGNVKYRPGVLLIKIKTDPKVYAVSSGGMLRWIKTEQLVKKFYGENWHLLIDDVAEIFFSDYQRGEDIDGEEDFKPDDEVNETETIDQSQGKGKKLGHLKRVQRANTTKCRATPAIPATPGHKGTPTIPATPATPARDCKLLSQDKTAPIISNIAATPSATSTIIIWTTDENATSEVKYADQSLTTATSTKTISNSNLVTNHSLNLTNLTASTTYYYILKSTDVSSNTASTTEATFKTTD